MEDNTLRGIQRMIDYRSPKLYKLGSSNHWFIVKFRRKNFTVLSGSVKDFIDEVFDAICYRIDYKGSDPYLNITFQGEVDGIKIKTSEVKSRKGRVVFRYFFSVCGERICKGCGDSGDNAQIRVLTLTPVSVKEFPLYMQNVTSEFEKLMKMSV